MIKSKLLSVVATLASSALYIIFIPIAGNC